MTRETKMGLLVGMGVILLIGIIVSDHLSVVQHQDAADLTKFADGTSQTLTPPEQDQHQLALNDPSQAPPSLMRQKEIPTSGEMNAKAMPPTGGATQGPQQLVGAVDPRLLQGGPANVNIPANFGPGPAPATNLGAGVAQPPAKPEVVHFVEARETLYQIAKKYYRNGEDWRLIADANPGKVGKKGELRPGVRLVIPDKPGQKPADAPAAGLANNPNFTPVNNEQAAAALSGGIPVPGMSASVEKTIEVGPRDTLSKLAAKYLGDKNRWQELLDANKGTIKNARDLKPGMKLKLPAAQQAKPTAPLDAPMMTPKPGAVLPSVAGNVPVTPTTPIVIAEAPKTYRVQEGDTLVSIATKTLGDGGQWKQLFEANRTSLDSPDDLVIGQELVVPARM